MTDKSFQSEIPPARVNIQLSVDKGGAQKKTELPLKLLVLSDLTRRNGGPRLSERERISLDKGNFDRVMGSLGLTVDAEVPDRISGGQEALPVRLEISGMRSFEPPEIVRQVPALSRLVAARNLIRDLGSNLLDNREFRKRLENVLADSEAVEALLAELDATVPEKKD